MAGELPEIDTYGIYDHTVKSNLPRRLKGGSTSLRFEICHLIWRLQLKEHIFARVQLALNILYLWLPCPFCIFYSRLDLLKLIMGATDAWNAATATSFAIRSAMENQDPFRQQALISLLGSGAHGPDVRTALAHAFLEGPSNNPALTTRCFSEFRWAITSAVQQGYLATLDILLNAEARIHHVAPAAFKNAMRLPQLLYGSSAPLRLPIIKLLTHPGVQASQS